jgi:hypothetical protein
MTDEPRSSTEEDELAAALEAAPEPPNGASSSRAHALTDSQANALANLARPTVVILAGGAKSGKTTLLASLYERFSYGPIGGTRFAGSLTLPGFEARADGIRPRDGSRSQMPHTNRNAVPWLHLRVRRADRMRQQDLLLGDFDGEYFDRVVEGKDPPDIVPGLRRADHIAIVVDGEALIEPTKRAVTVQRTRDLITRLSEPDVVASWDVFGLVLTKLDLVNSSVADTRRQARRDLDELRKYLSARTGGRDVGVIETAAISAKPDLPVGHGADELLDEWQRVPAVAIAPPPVVAAAPNPSEWFPRFKD